MSEPVYLVLEDFGHHGRGWRETDEHNDRASLLKDLIDAQYEYPIRIVAFHPEEGWAHDVSADIAAELNERRYDLVSGVLAFVDGQLDAPPLAPDQMPPVVSLTIALSAALRRIRDTVQRLSPDSLPPLDDAGPPTAEEAEAICLAIERIVGRDATDLDIRPRRSASDRLTRIA